MPEEHDMGNKGLRGLDSSRGLDNGVSKNTIGPVTRPPEMAKAIDLMYNETSILLKHFEMLAKKLQPITRDSDEERNEKEVMEEEFITSIPNHINGATRDVRRVREAMWDLMNRLEI
jgi:hypothetical protein